MVDIPVLLTSYFFCLQIPNMTQIKSQICNKADDVDFKSSMLILKKSNLVKQIEGLQSSNKK